MTGGPPLTPRSDISRGVGAAGGRKRPTDDSPLSRSDTPNIPPDDTKVPKLERKIEPQDCRTIFECQGGKVVNPPVPCQLDPDDPRRAITEGVVRV